MIKSGKSRCIFSLFFLLIFNAVFVSAGSLVLFSSNDKLSDKLIQLINQTKLKIHAAVYLITDLKIANALKQAKEERGVDVQIITDRSCLESEFGKIEVLKQSGIDVFIYKPPGKNKRNRNNKFHSSIMHNKFAILDNGLWTGSFNWTKSGSNKNLENVIFTDDPQVCKSYSKHFEELKRRCIHQVVKPKNLSNSLSSSSSSIFNNQINPRRRSRSYYTRMKRGVVKMLRQIKKIAMW